MACTARGCDSCASRAAEVVSASHSMCVLVVQVASRLTVSQWPITRAPQKHFDVLQARVAMWEHVRRWRGSHACSVCDERALHARARVEGAEQRARAWQWRGRGVGEGRCATCLLALGATFATFLCTVQNALRAYLYANESKPTSWHAVSRSQDSQRPPAHTAAASWRRAGACDCPCHLTHANTRSALILTATHVV